MLPSVPWLGSALGFSALSSPFQQQQQHYNLSSSPLQQQQLPQQQHTLPLPQQQQQYNLPPPQQQQLYNLPQQQQQQQQQQQYNLPPQQQHHLPQPPMKPMPWLVMVGESCYSDRQISGGNDLSSTRKKYKKMYCAYCAEFNPATPWAQIKPRKYEKLNLLEHEKSAHHLKSVTARTSQQSNKSGVVGDSISSNNTVDEPSPSSLNFDVSSDLSYDVAKKPRPTLSNSFSSNPLAFSDSSASSALPPLGGMWSANTNELIAAHVAFLSANPIRPPQLPTFSVFAAELVGNSNARHPTYHYEEPHLITQFPDSASASTYQKLIQDAIDAPQVDFEPKRLNLVVAPDWAKCIGHLRLSEKQILSGRSNIKKKYKMIMCSICKDHAPDSPWAVLKPRKFETCVFQEHERSPQHRQAVSTKISLECGVATGGILG